MTVLVRLVVISILVGSCVGDGAAAEIQHLITAGKARTYLIERPGLSGPRPTIIMLHGAGGTSADIAKGSGLGELGPRREYTVVFPQGLAGFWNSLPPEKLPSFYLQMMEAYGGVPDDVNFLQALVADLVDRGIADRERIYLAGISNGSLMTLQMACLHGELFAGIGMFLGAMIEEIGAECHPKQPIPTLIVNGTSDPSVPYEGGPILGPVAVWSNDRLVAFFRQLNGCLAAPKRSTLPGRQSQVIEIERSEPCGGAPVTLYRIVGGGHEVRPPLNVGRLLLEFFDKRARL